MKITVWSKHVVDPQIGQQISDPIGAITTIHGELVRMAYGYERMPQSGKIAVIGDYRNNGHLVAVEVEVSPELAALIDPADIHEN